MAQAEQGKDIPRWRTAIARKSLSRPSLLSLKFGLYNKKESILDYGAGRGVDVAELQKDGFNISAWDPHFFPDNPKTKADTVNLGYVLNVIENPEERKSVLKEAFSLAKKCLVVSVRPEEEGRGLSNAKPYHDGVLTSTGTFQKFFSHDELEKYLSDATGVRPYFIDPHIAVLFKDKAAEQQFLKEQSPGKQKPAAQKKTSDEKIIGKNVGGTLYVHISAKERLPADLQRLVDHAADLLKTANKNGTVQVAGTQAGFHFDAADTTLIKIAHDGSAVSFLKYKDFDADPHPEKSVLIRLDGSSVKGQDFSMRANKPILYRKETFVAPDYPNYKEFAALTRDEEKAGLYKADLSKIGTEKGWEKVLAAKSYIPRYHP